MILLGLPSAGQRMLNTGFVHSRAFQIGAFSDSDWLFTTAARFENKVKYNFCTDCHFTAGKAGSDNQRIQLIVAAAQILTACYLSVNCMAPAQESE